MRRATRAGRGAILLDVMLSVVLFVGAASFCLAATRSMFAALDRAQRRQWAVDLARSKMAELAAGLILIQELRGEWSGAVGSHPEDDQLEPQRPGARPRRWEIDVETHRTEFRGLSLIELTVSEIPTETGADDEDEAIAFTLRQLVALREAEVEEYEVDELLEGLPGVPAGREAEP